MEVALKMNITETLPEICKESIDQLSIVGTFNQAQFFRFLGLAGGIVIIQLLLASFLGTRKSPTIAKLDFWVIFTFTLIYTIAYVYFIFMFPLL